MKVALVTAFPCDADKPRGGVEAVSVNLAQALAELPEMEVHVVTTDCAVVQPEKYQWQGATVHRLPQSGQPLLAEATGPGRRAMHIYLRQLQPDVVHAHDVYGLMVQGLELPRVFTIHGFIHADTSMSGTRLAWLRAWLWRRAELASWAEQPHIISISPYVRERISGIVRGVIHDIDNPIAPECFAVEPRSEPATIFCAGALGRRKNQLALVDALALLRAQGIEAQLRLAGHAGEQEYVQLLQHRINELDLARQVSLLGAIDSAQVRAELAGASVFALVSFEEGSPMGIEEAMAAGVPVVTSNRCGMPYMVCDGASGFLVNPHDTAEIAARLGQLLTNPELRCRMSEQARRIALERFHPTAVAQRTREVYQRAMGIHSLVRGKEGNDMLVQSKTQTEYANSPA